jgi:hypothetical protein
MTKLTHQSAGHIQNQKAQPTATNLSTGFDPTFGRLAWCVRLVKRYERVPIFFLLLQLNFTGTFPQGKFFQRKPSVDYSILIYSSNLLNGAELACCRLRDFFSLTCSFTFIQEVLRE